MRKFIIILLFFVVFLVCTNKKEYCNSRLKEGPDIQGINSAASCTTHIILENQIKEKLTRGENVSRDKTISDSFLILCLQKNIQEKKCSGESEYIPHLGY